MHQQPIGKISIAGDVQFKRIPFHQMPVHDNPHAAVVVRRHDAYKQNSRPPIHQLTGDWWDRV